MTNKFKKVFNKVVVCPDCGGKGYKYIFTGDSDSERTCETCNGNRVLNRVVTIEYEELI